MKRYIANNMWWKKMISYFEGYPRWLVEIGLSFVIAFVIGFVCKNFGRYLVFIILIICVAGFALNYFSLVTFHIMHIKQMLGITVYPTFDIGIQALISWVRANLPIVIGSLVGFLFGWKLGK